MDWGERRRQPGLEVMVWGLCNQSNFLHSFPGKMEFLGREKIMEGESYLFCSRMQLGCLHIIKVRATVSVLVSGPNTCLHFQLAHTRENFHLGKYTGDREQTSSFEASQRQEKRNM